MLTKLAPSAVKPPSPNRKHWTISTAAMTTAPAHGPSITAASTPPSRCPETPGPDREVHHLRGEDEGGHHPHERRRPLAEPPLHRPQAVPQPPGAHDPRDRRHTGNEKAIRNMHRSCPETQWAAVGRSVLTSPP